MPGFLSSSYHSLFNKIQAIKSDCACGLKALHEDERGAEGLEKLLIIAAIVLPLLGLLIVFRDKISEWVTDTWGEVAEGADYDDSQTIPNPS